MIAQSEGRFCRLVMRVAVASAALLSASAVQGEAPTPLAQWSNGFSTTVKNGVTLSLNGNEVSEDSTAVVLGSGGSKGLRLDWREKPLSSVSVMVKYSGMTSPDSVWRALGVFRSAYKDNSGTHESDHPGVARGADGGTIGVWEDGAWTGSGQTRGTFVQGDGSGAFVLRYDPSSQGVTLYQKKASAWEKVYDCVGLRASTEYYGTAENGIFGVGVGGLCGSDYTNVAAFAGMKIHVVEVYDHALSEAEIGKIVVPADVGVLAVTLTEAGSPYKWSELPWSGPAPTKTTETIEIAVQGAAELVMDTSSVQVFSCRVCGAGSLKISGSGFLSAHDLSTEVPLALATEGEDVVFAPGLQATDGVSVGMGCLLSSGCVKSAGATGGVLRLAGGILELKGDEALSGGLVVDEGAVVVTTKGQLPMNVSGGGEVCFRTVMPDGTAKAKFLDSSWRGTCRLEKIAATVADFDPSEYGNSGSKVCLAGVSGWLPLKGSCPFEVQFAETTRDGEDVVRALDLTDGYSQGEYVFSKISGRGWFYDSKAQVKQVIRVLDISDFHGSVRMRGKRLVLGANASPKEYGGTIYIPEGETLDSLGGADSVACGSVIADNGVYVDGTVTNVSSAFFLKDNTLSSFHVGATGKIVLIMTPAFDLEYNNVDYQPAYDIDGEGQIIFTDLGTGMFRALPKRTDQDWNPTLSVINDQGRGKDGGLLLCVRGTVEEPAVWELGTLSGTGGFRTDANLSGGVAPNRSIRVTQREDGVWSGVMTGGSDNLADFIVQGDPDVGEKTLTLTGVNTQYTDRLVVAPTGSVRLDGTWNGDVLVSGVFGGNGTNTNGSVIFASGAVIDATRGTFHAASLGDWPAELLVRVEAEDFTNRRAPLFVCEGKVPNADHVDVKVQLSNGRKEKAYLVALAGTVYVKQNRGCLLWVK